MNKNIKPRSIMTIPIIDITYRRKKRHDYPLLLGSTICKIRWINPCNGNTQVTYGVANCDLNDGWDDQIGMRLAESRAKINMYTKYINDLKHETRLAVSKHSELIVSERQHQMKIKPSKDNM